MYIYGVTDNYSGVNRVQFPTWTDYNGQDDIDYGWPTSSGVTGQNLGNGTWYFRVNSSAHNNEYGKYETHIYLYDNVGNYSAFQTSGATITNPNVVAKFNLSNNYFDGNTIYSQDGGVSNNYTVEFDAMPTKTIVTRTQGSESSGYISDINSYIIMDNWGQSPNAGLGMSLGSNGVNIVVHGDCYYHYLLTYYSNLNAWHHYKLIVKDRQPILYIDGNFIKNGDFPYSQRTNIFTNFTIGEGTYTGKYDVNYGGYANNFVFYNVAM